MPRPKGIDPYRNYWEIGADLRPQFEKKGRAAKLRFSDGKGLYVASSWLADSPDQLVRSATYGGAKHQKMIQAGRTVKQLLQDAIDREFPEFRVEGQSIGEFALAAVRAHQLDGWAFNERERIEKLVNDPYFSNEDIDLPYTHDPYERELLFGKDLNAEQKEQRLKALLSKDLEEAVTCELNGRDIGFLQSQVLLGLRMAAHHGRDVGTRNKARDHLQILNEADYRSDSPRVRARSSYRHKIIEDNHLLRRAIADDLRSNRNYADRADEAARAIVDNLQTSTAVLNLKNTYELADFLENLGCSSAHVQALAQPALLYPTLLYSVEYAKTLNQRNRSFIESLELTPNYGITKAAKKYTAALEALSDLIRRNEFGNEEQRMALAADLLNCTAAFADIFSKSPFKDASDVWLVNMARDMRELARISNELALVLKDPSVVEYMPSLKKLDLPEALASAADRSVKSEKCQEAERIIQAAVAADFENDRHFVGDADAAAATIVAQVHVGKDGLTPQIIAALQRVLGGLNIRHANVDRLVAMFDLDQKLTSAIPQIRDLTAAVVHQKKVLSKDKNVLALLQKDWDKDWINALNEALEEAERLRETGAFDDAAMRQQIGENLQFVLQALAAQLGCFELLDRKFAGSSYKEVVALFEKEIAAVLDLAQAVYPAGFSGNGKAVLGAPYPIHMRDKEQIQRVEEGVLKQQVELPLTLFKSDQSRRHAFQMLGDPMRYYNAWLSNVQEALHTYKENQSRATLSELKQVLAQTLALNNHLTNIFNDVNRLRNTGRRGQYDDEMPLLEQQRECLQLFQAAAFRVMDPEWTDEEVEALRPVFEPGRLNERAVSDLR